MRERLFGGAGSATFVAYDPSPGDPLWHAGRHATRSNAPITLMLDGVAWSPACQSGSPVDGSYATKFAEPSPPNSRSRMHEFAHRGGIAAKVFSIFSSTASVDRTPASMYRSPRAAVDLRASPHVPDFVAQYTEPGDVKKKAVCTGAVLTVNSGNGGNSTFARSRSTNAGLMASTADVSAALACNPFFSPENSATSWAVRPSQ